MPTFLKDLNNVQRQAVETLDGPVMIIAGAGSGKTRVLTYRIAHLLRTGVSACNVLALTFTNKAAREMRDRIAQVVSNGDAARLWMGTFHSMFARLLRREADKIGFRKNFSIYDTEDAAGLIKAILQESRVSLQQITPSSVHARISHAKNRMMTPADLANNASDLFDEKVAGVFEEYQKRLRAANAMDFDDLLLNPIMLFDERPDVLAQYQQQFRYILIDEYQDTNRAQYQIVRRLASAHNNICVVGDDAQSIYAFRGADISNILDFERHFHGVRTFRLEQNYRSTQKILTGADSVIKNNAKQIPKTLWTSNPAGDPILVLECSDELDEAKKVIRAMQELGRKKKLQLKDFAVLYRTNAQSRALEDGFRRMGIPYVIIGGIAFYRRREVKDLLAYLRLCVNPSDDEAAVRVINYPQRGIGQTTVGRLRSYASDQGVSFFEAAINAASVPSIGGAAVARIGTFVSLVQKYGTLRHEMSAGELAASLVNELGLIEAFKTEGTAESQTRLDNVQELVSAMQDFHNEEGQNSLESFLTEASLVADVDSMDSERNAVTLMTLHSAKGLEFPVVFLAGLEEGLFPSSLSIQNDEVEEERRLCYVGMTRAMDFLCLSFARHRMVWGERMEQVPSRFLGELDVNVIQREAAPRRTAPEAKRPAVHHTPRSGWSTMSRAGKSEYNQDVDYTYSQIESEFRKGSQVIHETFGRGTILAIEGPGDSARAVVLFESVGKKTLVLKYAKLKSV
jgi:DNA helicase-2/ATP-dependent DNA helicase PcrA